MKAVVFNLGCKVNQYESDMLLQELSNRGIEVSAELEKADFYIINTCAITAEAERKSRQAIKRCLCFNPNAKIYIWGCAGEYNPQKFGKTNVVAVYGAKDKYKILDLIDKDFDIKYSSSNNLLLSNTNRTRAYVKVQDGCNNFCNYCIIPYLRGRSRSRDIDSIVAEIEALSKGHKEIVITGINLMLFGKDNNTDLAKLISRIADINVRIRLGSVYAEAITPQLLEALFALKHFCPHFHLSLQSGDNEVLRSMNRHYTTTEYRSKVDLIRTYDNNVAITTDLIVGYPTEKETNFINTINFIQDINFSDIHIFPFSQRRGTKAACLQPIPREIIKERVRQAHILKKDLRIKYLNANIGVIQSVLFEEKTNGMSKGYSDRYIKIYANSDEELASILPSQIFKDGLKGEIIK